MYISISVYIFSNVLVIFWCCYFCDHDVWNTACVLVTTYGIISWNPSSIRLCPYTLHDRRTPLAPPDLDSLSRSRLILHVSPCHPIVQLLGSQRNSNWNVIRRYIGWIDICFKKTLKCVVNNVLNSSSQYVKLRNYLVSYFFRVFYHWIVIARCLVYGSQVFLDFFLPSGPRSSLPSFTSFYWGIGWGSWGKHSQNMA